MTIHLVQFPIHRMKFPLLLAAAFAASSACAAVDLAAGAAKAQACFLCHGPGGVSQTAQTPSLAGQPDGFIQ